MRIIEKERLNYPAAFIWPFVVNPENFIKWNDKITRIEAGGEFKLGQQFATGYRLSSNESQCLTEVTALEENRLLELRHSNCVSSKPGQPDGMEALERITLEEREGSTLVTKTVTVRNHRIPLLLLPLIWFVTRFGKPAGPSRLEQLCKSAKPAALS